MCLSSTPSNIYPIVGTKELLLHLKNNSILSQIKEKDKLNKAISSRWRVRDRIRRKRLRERIPLINFKCLPSSLKKTCTMQCTTLKTPFLRWWSTTTQTLLARIFSTSRNTTFKTLIGYTSADSLLLMPMCRDETKILTKRKNLQLALQSVSAVTIKSLWRT